MSFPDDNFSKAQLGGEAVNSLRTQLTGAVSTVALVLPVQSTAGFPDGSSGIVVVRIGTPAGGDEEMIRYSSKDDTNFYVPETGGRNYDGRGVHVHEVDDFVNFGLSAESYNRVCETVAGLETFVRDEGRSGLFLQAAEDIDRYDCVTMNGVGRWVKTDIDFEETSWCDGMALTAIPMDAFGVASAGIVDNSEWSWNPQKLLYLSTTPGGISEDRPGVGKFVCCVGKSVLPKKILFVRPYLEMVSQEI